MLAGFVNNNEQINKMEFYAGLILLLWDLLNNKINQ